MSQSAEHAQSYSLTVLAFVSIFHISFLQYTKIHLWMDTCIHDNWLLKAIIMSKCQFYNSHSLGSSQVITFLLSMLFSTCCIRMHVFVTICKIIKHNFLAGSHQSKIKSPTRMLLPRPSQHINYIFCLMIQFCSQS